eukprot:TRINITY_DN34275_c0_g1_i1.p1 TRINITY_DN34275_c0_g1~~TRINITY_DN34275_c0_g1_i1.p1  ORF type:complete len:118 (+),score=7.22 TRINITY_DN34275_c0_g1_i1:43-354(+)
MTEAEPIQDKDWDSSWGVKPTAATMVVAGGSTFAHPVSNNERPPAPDYVRTPGGGWAPLATRRTVGYSTKIRNQYVVDGKAFPTKVMVFPRNINSHKDNCSIS